MAVLGLAGVRRRRRGPAGVAAATTAATATAARSSSARRTSPRTPCWPRSTPVPWRRPVSRSRPSSTSASREVYLKALEPGDESVDIFPEYTGVLRDYFERGDARHRVRRGLRRARRPCCRTTSRCWSPRPPRTRTPWSSPRRPPTSTPLTEIGDLAPVAGDLTLGGPPEWKTRATGVPGLEEVYGVSSATSRPSTPAAR